MPTQVVDLYCGIGEREDMVDEYRIGILVKRLS